jgi:hypothetical protein
MFKLIKFRKKDEHKFKSTLKHTHNENYVHSQFSHTNYHISSPYFNPHLINKISDPISEPHYS